MLFRSSVDRSILPNTFTFGALSIFFSLFVVKMPVSVFGASASLESAALNPVVSTGEKMGEAALNTLIGMGIVFVVLILISCLISCFVVIPKIQARFSKNKKDIKTESITKTIEHITQQETVNLTNDYELVAVIAAAIAASEGASSTDGFIVRSIRKRIKSK